MTKKAKERLKEWTKAGSKGSQFKSAEKSRWEVLKIQRVGVLWGTWSARWASCAAVSRHVSGRGSTIVIQQRHDCVAALPVWCSLAPELPQDGGSCRNCVLFKPLLTVAMHGARAFVHQNQRIWLVNQTKHVFKFLYPVTSNIFVLSLEICNN